MDAPGCYFLIAGTLVTSTTMIAAVSAICTESKLLTNPLCLICALRCHGCSPVLGKCNIGDTCRRKLPWFYRVLLRVMEVTSPSFYAAGGRYLNADGKKWTQVSSKWTDLAISWSTFQVWCILQPEDLKKPEQTLK
ncbi:hypothetical protein Nepgr_001981 [Nepenthes gracilis]|uniref:Secreted protein n=1 Tax=Nepenthes gracilis TaxID=150966 RepID=A0AAD3P9F0_NEPGR|nr:hypothetical protein Nepgr_001981 [Nepenthes gracilis]